MTWDWDGVQDQITGFQIRRRQWGANWSDSWSPVSGGVTARSAVVRGLTNGVRYQFQVRAVSATIDGAAGTSGWVAPSSTTFLAPTVTAAAGDGRVVVGWTWGGERDTITKFRVRKRQWGANWVDSWTDVAGSASTSYVFTGLTNGVQYQFQVRAASATAEGEIGTSEWVTPSSTAIPAPVISGLLPGDRSVDVMWEWEGNADLISGFQIRRRVRGQNWTDGWSSVAGGPNARNLVVGGLSNGVEYQFQVRAVGHAAGVFSPPSGPSEWVAPRGPNRPPVVAGLVASRVLAVENGTEEIGLATIFSDPDGDDLTFAARSSATKVVNATINAGPPPVLVLQPQTPGEAVVTVTATDPGGLTVSTSFSVKVTRTDISAPRNLRLTPSGATALNVRWDPPARGAGKVNRYRLEYRGDASPWTDERVEGATSHLITDLQYGCRYHVRVRGEDESTIVVGDPPQLQTVYIPGEWSEEKSVVLGNPGRCNATPPVPAQVEARITSRRIMLVSWTRAAADYGVEAHEVRHRVVGGEWTVVPLEAGAAPPWRSASLDPGDYEVQVRSQNRHGWSAWSAVVGARVVADPVLGVAAVGTALFGPGGSVRLTVAIAPPSVFDLTVTATVEKEFVLEPDASGASGSTLRLAIPAGTASVLLTVREAVPYFDYGEIRYGHVVLSGAGPAESGVSIAPVTRGRPSRGRTIRPSPAW